MATKTTAPDAKFILDSTTIRAVLVTLIAPTKLLLETCGVKFDSHIVDAAVELGAVAISVGAGLYLAWKRNKQAPLTFTR